MNKIMFIKIFLLTIVFIILGIDLFTDYTLNKWIKAIGFLFLSILALIDLIKKKDWFCKLLFGLILFLLIKKQNLKYERLFKCIQKYL